MKGAEIDAYAWDKDKPTSACFKAPQSLAPSPHIKTVFPRLWYSETTLTLSFGFVLEYTDTCLINYFWISVSFYKF